MFQAFNQRAIQKRFSIMSLSWAEQDMKNVWYICEDFVGLIKWNTVLIVILKHFFFGKWTFLIIVPVGKFTVGESDVQVTLYSKKL